MAPREGKGKGDPNPSTLRDSLNKRRQELDTEMRSLRSKIITAFGGQAIEDEFDHESPFIKEIQAIRLPANFKEPHMTPYEGSTYPKYHLDAFNDLMKLRGISSGARCHCFAVTLKGPTYKWFKRLRPGSIRSWQQFYDEFLQHHHPVRDYTMLGTSLANVKQGENESLKSYIHRFNMEATKVGSLTRRELKMAITTGVRSGSQLWDNMLKREVTDLDNFYERAQKYIRVEDGHESLKAGKGQSPPKPSIRESQSDAEKKRVYEGIRDDQPRKPQRTDERRQGPYTSYTDFTHAREHIFVTNENQVPFRRPSPMKKDPIKYFQYHKDIGHTTVECNHLKVEIEELIRRGHLGRYVCKESQRPKKGASSPRAQEVAPKIQGEVNTIFGGPGFGGESRKGRDKYTREARRSPPP
ncbi:uncharacterized protein LOC133782862 isoform X1 [Humulus lupulus]|uniref:uncharacterized protein LOC133782862 isoform X1 n=1 Tax=Humulus lupulus TaxID=3486 RepID=UPI002B407314|nr:uncharacterized protein LOC133782862 isoform X1 [Humulus lupulus]